MNFSARIPLVRLLLPFVAGIVFAYSFRIRMEISILLIVIFSGVALLFLHRKLLKRSLLWIGFDGIIISLSLFFVGAALTSLELQPPLSSPLNGSEKVLAMHVRLLNDPVVKEKSVKLFVDVREWKDSVAWKTGEEKMVVYLQREEAAEKLQYGDELLIHASPTLVKGPKNPEEFDYRAFLERLGVRGQVYAKSGEWKLESRNGGNAFKSCALELRRYFLGKLQSYGMSGAAFGVSAALLLGASDHLDPGTIQAYSASGTLHVLSVSGMHVALVYVVLLRLLAPLDKRKGGKWISIAVQLVFLWFYATLTGLCPSVLRSVTMLSVVIAGRAFNKNAHILNSLAASALILLFADPLMLFDIGFQLSYLAVAGIVMLQPKLEELWQPEFWLTKQIWTLISVTIVAQVFTFPLGLYYFKQFPTYFLLSNLVVIPLSTITMYAGLALLIVSPFAIIAKPIALLFGFLVEVLNASVSGIEHLPHSVMHSAKWEKSEMIFLYVFVICVLVYLSRKNKRWLQGALVSFLFLLLVVAYGNENFIEKRELIIFNVNHSSALAVVNGNNHILFADTSLLQRKGDIDFHIEPFLKANGWEDETIHSLEDSIFLSTDFVHSGKGRMKAMGKQIVIVDPTFSPTNEKETCDILLLHGNPKTKLDTLISHLNPSLVVADGSDGKWRIKKWKTICEQRKINFYDVQEQGALIINN